MSDGPRDRGALMQNHAPLISSIIEHASEVHRETEAGSRTREKLAVFKPSAAAECASASSGMKIP